MEGGVEELWGGTDVRIGVLSKSDAPGTLPSRVKLRWGVGGGGGV